MSNYSAIIRGLRDELTRVERAITQLESLQAGTELPKSNRAGRKSMGAEERQQVSARMKRYWASRRKQRV